VTRAQGGPPAADRRRTLRRRRRPAGDARRGLPAQPACARDDRRDRRLAGTGRPRRARGVRRATGRLPRRRARRALGPARVRSYAGATARPRQGALRRRAGRRGRRPQPRARGGCHRGDRRGLRGPARERPRRRVGGGFGVKAVLYAEDVALCLMAIALPDTPVRWIEDRAEHLLAAAHARDHRYVLRAGLAADGELLALDADITVNVGAYSLYPWTAGIEPLMAGGLLSGPYRLEHYRCATRGVATNTAPVGPYRGVARPATVFAMEAVLDEAGRRLSMAPEAIRRRNLITRDDVPYQLPTRVVDQSGNYPA